MSSTQRARIPSRCRKRSPWCLRSPWSPPPTWARSEIAGRRRASRRWNGLSWRFGSSAAGVAVVLTVLALVLPPISTTDIWHVSSLTASASAPTAKGVAAAGRGDHRLQPVGHARWFAGQPPAGGHDLHGQHHRQRVHPREQRSAVRGRQLVSVKRQLGSWRCLDRYLVSAGSAATRRQPCRRRCRQRRNAGHRHSHDAAKSDRIGAAVPFTGDPVSSSLPGQAWGVESPTVDELNTIDQERSVRLYRSGHEHHDERLSSLPPRRSSRPRA